MKIFIKVFAILTLSINNFLFIEKSTSQTNLDIKYKPTFDYLKKNNYSEYLLGPGDLIFISIAPQIEELSGEYLIDGAGTIFLPYIDRVYIKGLTINELINILNKKYSEYINGPETKIRITRHRPVRYFTQGEIENPGLHTLAGSYSYSTTNELNREANLNNVLDDFTLEYKLEEIEKDTKFEPNNNPLSAYFPTIFDAIQESGGISIYSDLTNVQIIRRNSISNGGGLISTTINLLDVLIDNDSTQNIRIFDGDKIIINKSTIKLEEQMSLAFRSNLNPKYISVLVTGNVRERGKKIVTRSTSLSDAIAMAGGALPLSGKAALIRYDEEGKVTTQNIRRPLRFEKGSKNNPYLKTGDIIVYNESSFSVLSTTVKTFTDPFLGIYSIYKLFD